MTALMIVAGGVAHVTLLPAADEAVTPAPESERNATSAPVTNRPVVPGLFRVTLRTRTPPKPDAQNSEPRIVDALWKASETAIIICDMWDDHYCLSSAQRVAAMAPRMNAVITEARNHGAVIVHAPSGCMDQYEETPHRRRMQQAPHAEPPLPIGKWCYLDPSVEPELPIDDSKSPCDDPVERERVRFYSRQHEAIRIVGFDGVSDRGQEIYNFFQELGIKNVVLMGVHTNMCVLGRPFGIRQLKRLGFNVVLARDLTDAMYDPREYPYVSHTRGTELVVEHIETYWCPSIVGDDLTKVVPGSNDPLPGTVDARAVEQN